MIASAEPLGLPCPDSEANIIRTINIFFHYADIYDTTVS